ncbi:MAG: 5-oxoprolinase subunit PxpA [Verrucomicrobiales bacterium]
MLPLDLNCDLAEGEPAELTAALMALLTSANLACAGHAGSVDTLRRALDLGRSAGIHLGAHPGLPGHFGRGSVDHLTPNDFLSLLKEQIGLFLELATAAALPMHHVKLHGALYHATESTEALRDTFIHFLLDHAPTTIVYALAGGRTVAAARAAGLPAWDEAFADRAYLPNGSLVPRSHPNALITDPAAVALRTARLARLQPIPAIDGSPIPLRPQTLCLHADSPNALILLQAARQALESMA